MNLIDRVSTEFDKYGKYIAFATVAASVIVAVVVVKNMLTSKG